MFSCVSKSFVNFSVHPEPGTGIVDTLTTLTDTVSGWNAGFPINATIMSNGTSLLEPRLGGAHYNNDMSNLSTNSRTPTVAIDPVALVVTECITVTSAMRKHARWAHSSVSAILGGGTTKRPSVGGRSPHARNDSGDSLGLGEEDGVLSTRWGLRGKKGRSMQDNPLLSAFARLRSQLKGCKGWADS